MELITPDYALLIWSVLSLLTIVLWVVALISILRYEFKGKNEKLIWVLVILLVPIVGAILYFFIGRGHRIKYNH